MIIEPERTLSSVTMISPSVLKKVVPDSFTDKNSGSISLAQMGQSVSSEVMQCPVSANSEEL